MKDVRAEALAQWARRADLNVDIPVTAELTPVSDDASFRRYFRFDRGAISLVFVDAPPEHEDNESFVRVAAALGAAGLNCPRVLAVDYEDGFMAVTDLGDRLYLDEISEHPDRVAPLYDDASDAILSMLPIQCDLPHYDADRLMTEMSLFHEWFLIRQLELAVTADELTMLESVYRRLADNALEQPQGFVHRDFHARNLMVQSSDGPGIIDFQDAVMGPVTYDLVSLFKDCYYRFDRSLVLDRVERFRRQLIAAGILSEEDPLLRWFDLMGAQRHLKCAGIFSRLNLRDGKQRYLADIPLVVSYLVEVTAIYPDLEELHQWLRRRVVSRMGDDVFVRAGS